MRLSQENPKSFEVPRSKLREFINDQVKKRSIESQNQDISSDEKYVMNKNSYIRMLGHTKNGESMVMEKIKSDVQAIVAMNNALVLDPADFAVQEGESPEEVQNHIKAYAANGWHMSKITEETLQNLFAVGGYAFLVEYEEEGIATPYGFQFGFPTMPPEKYKSLTLGTLPAISIFTEHEADTWTVWRTGILPRIEAARKAFEEIGVLIAPSLLGQGLQSKGAGIATKLVDAVAAQELNKFRVQCNIGEMMRPGNEHDIIAKNERSFGSNRQIFEETRFHRTHVDYIRQSPSGPVLMEICWKVLANTPQAMINIAEKPGSPLIKKGWDIGQLKEAGKKLASILKLGSWKMHFSKEKIS